MVLGFRGFYGLGSLGFEVLGSLGFKGRGLRARLLGFMIVCFAVPWLSRVPWSRQ